MIDDIILSTNLVEFFKESISLILSYAKLTFLVRLSNSLKSSFVNRVIPEILSLFAIIIAPTRSLFETKGPTREFFSANFKSSYFFTSSTKTEFIFVLSSFKIPLLALIILREESCSEILNIEITLKKPDFASFKTIIPLEALSVEMKVNSMFSKRPSTLSF